LKTVLNFLFVNVVFLHGGLPQPLKKPAKALENLSWQK
jgi:hypothetical protein